MRDIGQLSISLLKWSKNLEKNLIEAVENTAKTIQEDVVENAPSKNGEYTSSIKVGETEVKNNKIRTSVFSDLLVGGSNPKWAKVPLAAFLEWGTGIKGASSNTYPHGYGYRLTPWCYYDEYLHQWITTDGIIARPHFYPALSKNKSTFLEEIRKAVKKCKI